VPNPRLFTRENLNEQQSLSDSPFRPFRRRRSEVWMMRVTGPFKVVTQHGIVECDDGWVAVDEEGWPYPISASVHAKSYEASEPT
jgi:hypothetical protein